VEGGNLCESVLSLTSHKLIERCPQKTRGNLSSDEFRASNRLQKIIMASISDSLSPLVEAANALAALHSAGRPTTQSRPLLPYRESAPLMIVSEDECNKKTTGATAQSRRSKRDIFPQRLMSVLNDPSLSSIITWLHHGRSFVILRPDVFTATVLPKYFSAESNSATKYPSFTRKLNRW
jgi:hypothetical protein